MTTKQCAFLGSVLCFFSIFAVNKNDCANVLEGQPDSWQMIELPRKLDLISEMTLPDDTLILVDQNSSREKHLAFRAWNFGNMTEVVDGIEPQTTYVAVTNEHHLLAHRPAMRSPNGEYLAELTHPGKLSVSIRRTSESVTTDNTVQFDLTRDKRPEGGARRGAQIEERDNFVHLAFSTDNHKLLGWNTVGFEVYRRTNLKRIGNVVLERGQSLVFAGWLSSRKLIVVLGDGITQIYNCSVTGLERVEESRPSIAGYWDISSGYEPVVGLVEIDGKKFLITSNSDGGGYAILDPATLSRSFELTLHLAEGYEVFAHEILQNGNLLVVVDRDDSDDGNETVTTRNLYLNTPNIVRHRSNGRISWKP